MTEYFDLALKGITTVMILYLAFNTIFRYHPSLNLIDFVTYILVTIISLAFIGTENFIFYFVLIGFLLITNIVARIVLLRKQVSLYVIYPITKNDLSSLMETLNNLRIEHNLSADELLLKRQWLTLMKAQSVDRKKLRTVIRDFDREVGKYPKRFEWFQYFHVIAALIMMAAIWRF